MSRYLLPCLMAMSILPSFIAQNVTEPQITYLYIGGDQGWDDGFEYPPYETNPGMQLVFQWNTQHNVVMLRDKTAYERCNFTGSTVLATTAQGRGNTQWSNIYVYNVTRVPVFFACSVGNHCANGMKFAAIEVGTAGDFNVSQATAAPTGAGIPTLPGTPTLPGGGPTTPGTPTIVTPGGNITVPTVPGTVTVAPTVAPGATAAPTTMAPTTMSTEAPTLFPTDASTVPPVTTAIPTDMPSGTTAAPTSMPDMATPAPTPAPTSAPGNETRPNSASVVSVWAAVVFTTVSWMLTA